MNDIFKTAKDRAEARIALPEVSKHPGWAVIQKAVDANVAHFKEQLRTRKDFNSLDEVYALQSRIDDIESFKELPATLLADAQEEPLEEDNEIY